MGKCRTGLYLLAGVPSRSLRLLQIISPHDSGIAKAIEANLEPLSWDVQAAIMSPMCLDVTEEMVSAYFKYISSLSLSR